MLILTWFGIDSANYLHSFFQRESAYSQLRVAHGGPLPPQEPPPPEPTDGAVLAEAHYKLLKQLFAATNPCKRLTGSHELHVFINPENPNEYFPLKMPRANAWAKAIVSLKSLFLTIKINCTNNYPFSRKITQTR
jgi:hypothetical protein